ncbi:MAG: NCS2 family permease [Firmicutes bacterium]|nr:NCS2 family permease [Bacillota bacterium]
MEKFFKLAENGTNVKTEFAAGLTTFMTMAYIFAVNPSILSASGMDSQAVLIATALAGIVGTLCMALLSNYPFALAPGMGLNAYFAFTVCGAMGYSWQIALAAVFVEGLIFIILSLTNIREAIFNAIPTTLKKGVSAGIGLFIAFIGLQDGGVIVNNDSTLVTYADFGADLRGTGLTAFLCIVGVLITGIMYARNIKGSILFGIIITWILAIICQVTGIYTGDSSFYPTLGITDFSSFGSTFGQVFTVDPGDLLSVNFLIVVFAFLFVDIFDTLGTLIGVSSKAGFLDEEGKLPRIKPALMADAIATCAGAVFGTSTTTTYVESASGVGEGGRTGLTGVFTPLFFLAAMFFAPIFTAIPSFAAGTALIFVGFLMISSILDIDFKNYTEAIPAYLCLIAMPMAYSIAEGIAIGVISYVVINFFTGKENRSKISLLMYILAILFVCKYIFL